MTHGDGNPVAVRPHLSVGSGEVVRVDVALGVTAERRSLNVGVAEVNTRPDARLEHLVA